MKKLLSRTKSVHHGLHFDVKIKFTLLFLLSVFFASYANSSYSQQTKATIDLRNVTIERFIDEMENTTNFRFVYKVNDVDLKRKVSITAKNEAIGRILEKVFRNRNISLSILQNQIYLKRENTERNGRPAKSSATIQFTSPSPRDGLLSRMPSS